jgi:hypothetical protein
MTMRYVGTVQPIYYEYHRELLNKSLKSKKAVAVIASSSGGATLDIRMPRNLLQTIDELTSSKAALT